MAAETPETLVVIPETDEDIPEELTDIPENDSSAVALHIAETAPESAVEQPAAKKKPGRPAGSRNKGPPKPRAKRVVVSEAVEYAPPPRVEDAPPPSPERSQWDAQHQPIPTDAKTEMAELMLRLLSGQSAERQRRKDALRRSWFA
jgi:hypothetical protein